MSQNSGPDATNDTNAMTDVNEDRQDAEQAVAGPAEELDPGNDDNVVSTGPVE